MEIPDLINLMEWNQFAENRKTLLEALTILNNKHRQLMAEKDTQITTLKTALEKSIQGLQTWCDDVDEDSSWSSWDRNFKYWKWEGIEILKTALSTPVLPVAGSGA